MEPPELHTSIHEKTNDERFHENSGEQSPTDKQPQWVQEAATAFTDDTPVWFNHADWAAASWLRQSGTSRHALSRTVDYRFGRDSCAHLRGACRTQLSGSVGSPARCRHRWLRCCSHARALRPGRRSAGSRCWTHRPDIGCVRSHRRPRRAGHTRIHHRSRRRTTLLSGSDCCLSEFSSRRDTYH